MVFLPVYMWTTWRIVVRMVLWSRHVKLLEFLSLRFGRQPPTTVFSSNDSALSCANLLEAPRVFGETCCPSELYIVNSQVIYVGSWLLDMYFTRFILYSADSHGPLPYFVSLVSFKIFCFLKLLQTLKAHKLLFGRKKNGRNNLLQMWSTIKVKLQEPQM